MSSLLCAWLALVSFASRFTVLVHCSPVTAYTPAVVLFLFVYFGLPCHRLRASVHAGKKRNSVSPLTGSPGLIHEACRSPPYITTHWGRTCLMASANP
jgi:hypothetical protein